MKGNSRTFPTYRVWAPKPSLAFAISAVGLAVLSSCGGGATPPLGPPSFDCSGALTLEQAWGPALASTEEEEIVVGKVSQVYRDWDTDWQFMKLGESGYTLLLLLGWGAPEDAEKYDGSSVCVRGDVVARVNLNPYTWGEGEMIILSIDWPADIGLVEDEGR